MSEIIREYWEQIDELNKEIKALKETRKTTTSKWALEIIDGSIERKTQKLSVIKDLEKRKLEQNIKVENTLRMIELEEKFQYCDYCNETKEVSSNIYNGCKTYICKHCGTITRMIEIF